MRWIGRISTFIVLQILFLILLLYVAGRIPQRELSLVWNVIRTGRSTLDDGAQPGTQEKVAKKAEQAAPDLPSFDEFRRAGSLRKREIEVQAAEAQTLLTLAKQEQAAVQFQILRLEKLQAELKAGIEDEREEYEVQGRKATVDLLEVEKPQLAKSFLLSLTDDNAVIGIIKQLDPLAAAKIFKEFTVETEIDQLNGWLEMMERGEPERSKLEEISDQVTAER